MTNEAPDTMPAETPEVDTTTVEPGHNLPKAVADAVGSYGNQSGATNPAGPQQ